LEGLEDRVTPATMNLPIAVDIPRLTSATPSDIVADVLFAGQKAGTATLALTSPGTTTMQNGDTCPILHLQLQPIHLNLLGLHADTSAICLDISANEQGGVLGDLLCGLGSNLNLGNLAQLNSILNQLDNLLDRVLTQPATVTDVLGGDTAAGTCDILNLSLGPVDLNLLGVNVALDNCADGPVTVDVTADPNGGLLGQVLCGLADGGLAGSQSALVRRLDGLIDRLGGLADRLGQLGDLPDVGKLTRQVEKLINKVEKLADRVDSLRDLDHLISQVDHTIAQLDHLIDRVS